MDFEKRLNEDLDRLLTGERKFHVPPHLADSIRYSVFSSGKRIRPRLVFACAEMLGLSDLTVYPAAAALELFHCFTLIHDDLPCMDNSDTRRGLPSNHKKFGEATALLAGDALMGLAVEVFLETPLPPQAVVSGLKTFLKATGPLGVMGGQAAESLLNRSSSLEELERMHAMKTGALFHAALCIPKELAGINDTSQEGQVLIDLGNELGRAFQIADDLEDPPTQKPEPTSILAHLSRQEAVRSSVTRLESAGKSASARWGRTALSLLTITDEVIAKLRNAGGVTSTGAVS